MPEHFVIVMILCLLLASGSGGVLLWLGGTVAGPRWAEVGLGVGFLAGFIAFAEGLPLIDDVSNPLLGETALAIVAMSAAAAIRHLPGIVACWLAAAAGAGAAFWIYDGPGFAILQGSDLAVPAALGVAGALLPFRLRAIADKGGLPIPLLIMAAAAMAFIAMIGHASMLSGLAFAYVAALAGISVWMWPLRRRSFAAAGLVQGGAITLSLAAAIARNSAVPAWGLLPLFGCLFPDLILARFRLAKKGRRRAKPPHPAGMMIVALGLAGIAIGVAFWSASAAAE